MKYDSERRAYNSSFRPISKKRLAAMKDGNSGLAWNSTLRPSRMRQMSDKARKRKDEYRNKGFEHWGYQCFLCGRVDESGKTLDIHHPRGRQNGDDITNLIPLCNRFCGCRAHNHNGMGDPRTRELNAKIQAKMDIYNGK